MIEATQTDESGFFVLQSISTDLAFLSIEASAKGYAPTKKDWSRKSRKRVGLTLAKAQTLRLRLVNDQERALPGLRVRIKNRPDLSCTSDAEGFAVFSGIAADTALWPRVDHPSLTHRREALFADRPERVLRLEQPATISGRVIDSLGRRLSGVELRHAHGPRAWVRTTSQRGGRFSIGDLPSGRVELHYETNTGVSGTVEVEVKRGEKRSDFVLRIGAQ